MCEETSTIQRAHRFVVECHVADKDTARKHVPFVSKEAARLVLTFADFQTSTTPRVLHADGFLMIL